MSSQSDTENYENKPMSTVDEQTVQSSIDPNDSSYSPAPVASSIKGIIKTYKKAHRKLVKNKLKSFRRVPYKSKYVARKSKFPPQPQGFVNKDRVSYTFSAKMIRTPEDEVAYEIVHDGETFVVDHVTMEYVNDDGFVETGFPLDPNYTEESGTNTEPSSRVMMFRYDVPISCDMCDAVFDDGEELMKHINSTHNPAKGNSARLA